jgi:signal transduction histidine kinase
VLSSQKQREILEAVNHHLDARLSMYIFFAALLTAFIVGVVTFYLITDSICTIAATVKRFKDGDYAARIEGYGKGNLGVLTSTFNDMADVIVDNIGKIMATDKFRQELIANVSHDLRTPLAIMRGYVETLMMKKDVLSDAERNKYLTVVYDGTRRLSALVEQLFQYAKLEANVIMPQKELFLVQELASDIIAAYQLTASKHAIDLRLDTPSNLRPVYADIALTERVFQNLLDNAFKFTPNGGKITIQFTQSASAIKVVVADTGIGISPEDQSYVFERYKQLDKDQVPKKGMGLGLAIVKKILELHQSTIEVNSEPGKGTAFKFMLPVASKTTTLSTMLPTR